VAGDNDIDDKKQKNMAHDFEWKKEYLLRQVKNDVLPYKTIDVVFNKKNIWINLQNPDPVRIYYDLYNNKRWFSVLKMKDAENKELVWKNDIPTFYSFRNFASPYSEDEIEQMKKTISKAVMEAIRSTRLIKNFPTKFKRAVINMIKTE
jgi:centrosomal protein CEP76